MIRQAGDLSKEPPATNIQARDRVPPEEEQGKKVKHGLQLPSLSPKEEVLMGS